MKRCGWKVCVWLAVLALPGCGDDASGISVDPGNDAGRVSDAFCASLGKACDGDGVCTHGTTCTGAEPFDVQAARFTREGVEPDSTRSIQVPAFPNGMCTSQCTIGNDACGGCAVCASAVSVGRRPVRANFLDDPRLGVCRPLCTPARSDRGGCAEGYACAMDGVCMNACRSDEQCKISLVDRSGDGRLEPIFDPEAPSVCDRATGRCGAPGVDVGAPCELDSDCGVFQRCLGTPDAPGICIQAFCNGEDVLPCADGAVCDVRNFGGSQGATSACLAGCAVASEAEDARLGEGGHGAGCPAGQSCVWDGQSAAEEAPNGGCLPGEYNDVKEPNVGEPCTEDSECYSPLGLGECRFDGLPGVATGTCAVRDCVPDRPRAVLPGVETSSVICPGERGACLPLNGSADRTVCLRACESSQDCPSTYGCVDVAGTGEKACHWLCESDADCRAGGRCVTEGGVPCAGSGSLCVCSADMTIREPDAGARDAGDVDGGTSDAGTEPSDAGTDAAVDAASDAAVDGG